MTPSDRRLCHLRRSVHLAEPIDQVFAFFADAANLQRMTPPWLDFRIVTPPPIRMCEGALIDYRLKVRGLPMRWRTRIDAWEPPYRFADTQVRGPYSVWMHEHRFEPAPDGGAYCHDHVRYRVPGGPLAPLLHRLWVRRDVEAIFDYRTRQLAKLFSARDDDARTAA